MQTLPNTPSVSSRLEWLDVLKCLAMLLVVVGHAVPKSEEDTLGYYIYSFHMPLFFIISGMTFYLQMKKRNLDFASLLKNKAKTLIVPYFILNLLTIPIWLINYRVLSYKDESIPMLLYAICYGNAKHVSGPSNALWFCLTLFLTLVTFWLVHRWAEGNEKNLTLMVLIIGTFGYGMSLNDSDFYPPWRIETVPIALMCVLAGWLLILHIDLFEKLMGSRKRQLLWICVLFPAAFCCAKYNNMRVSMAVNHYGSFMLFAGAVIGFSVICIILSKNLPPLRIFKLVGRNTIVMLAFHAPTFRFLEHYSQATAGFFESHPAIVGVLVFLVLIPVCYIVERFFPFLIGRSKKRKKVD